MSEDIPVTLKAIAAADGVNASITIGAPINKTYTGVIAGSQVVIIIPAADVVKATVMSYTSTAEGSTKTVSGNFIIDGVDVHADWVNTTFGSEQSSLIDCTTIYSIDRDHRYRYREIGSDTDQYSVEDTSTRHATHTLDITSVQPNTTYQIWPQSRDDSSSAWVDMAGPFEETTAVAAVSGLSIPIDLASRSSTNNRDNSEVGTWEGIAGYQAPRAQDTDGVMKVEMRPSGGTALGGGTNNGHYGVDIKYPLDVNADEVYVSYLMRAGNDCTSANMAADLKAVGIASLRTGGSYGGQGGLWGGKTRAGSARGLISEPDSTDAYADLAGGNEIYSYQSDNFKNGATIANHPANDPANQDPLSTGLLCNGKTFWTRTEDTGAVGHSSPHVSTSMADFLWHRYIDYMKVNTVGQNDGVFRRWFDGELCLEVTGLNFSDVATLRELCFWANIYHGGSATATGLHHVFLAHVNYCIGPVDNTTMYND